MGWPPSPGYGPYEISLSNPSFYLLATVLAVFVAMLLALRRLYPHRKRGMEGYLEAAGIDLAFLVFAVVLIVALAWKDPSGNRSSFALYRVILGGYWLTLAIPVVTVGSSVHSRSRGQIPWLYPSMAFAGILFAVLFAYYFSYG